MAGPYSDLTVEQLIAEIAEYRTAIKEAIKGGVGVVAAEGRRIEYTRYDTRGARLELRELEAELARRPGYEDRTAWAIGVEIV